MAKDSGPNGLKRFLLALAIPMFAMMALQIGILAFWCGSIQARMAGVETDISKIEDKCCP